MEKQVKDYLPTFRLLNEIGRDLIDLDSDLLIVQKMPSEDYTMSVTGMDGTVKKLIVATPGDHVRRSIEEKAPTFVKVLYAGPGFFDDDTKAPIDLNSKPGDILLVGASSVSWFSKLGPLENYDSETIGITREREVQIRFAGEQGYREVFRILNEASREKT
jgi:hypothetical protein